MAPQGWATVTVREEAFRLIPKIRKLGNNNDKTDGEIVAEALDHWFEAHKDDLACKPSTN